GGMGVVYAAYDDELDRKVALKVLRGKASSEGRKHRLIREAQGLARLSHPNVVHVYEIGEHGKDAFIAMEYVDGTTLGTWLEQEPRPRRAVLATFIAAGRGLAAAHAKGLVHRDFKPDNVMVTREGRALVMDFGLVHEASSEGEAQARVGKMHDSLDVSIEHSLRVSALSTDLTATGAMMGTPAYMSPEQFTGQRTDARTDQFSFAVALWEALCGERPFPGDDFATLCFAVTQGQRRDPPRGKLTRHLRATLERALAGPVEDRWPSMEAMLAALELDPARRRLLAAAAVVPLLLGVGGWQLWRLDQQADQRRAIATCEAEAAAIGEDWTPALRERIAADFHGTALPYADDSWVRTARVIDAYVDEWSRLRDQSCRRRLLPEASIEANETSAAVDPLEVATCLDEHRAALQGFLDTLAEVDADLVGRAVQTGANLPLLSSCTDPGALALRMQPAEDQREAIAGLRGELQRAGMLGITRPQQAREQVAAAVAKAEALGWAPLAAEANYRLADIDYRLGNFDEAKAILEPTFIRAGEIGHDRLALDAAIALAELTIKQEDYAMMAHWADLATMFIVRLGLERGDEAGHLATARGNALSNQSRLDE
ncbi:MAG: serine/threonine protein kinase, partial [Myxococcales bacterium]|nr:serine/threonine protein kinase [Myxococcales bacterium]